MKIGMTNLKPKVRLATEKQIEFMKTIGLEVKPGLTLNEARKMISNEIEERRADHSFCPDYEEQWYHDPYY